MSDRTPAISVTLCTYFRPDGLRRCLQSLIGQETSHTFEIVVVDNDADGSARAVVEGFLALTDQRGINLSYHIEPEQNIALARNRAVAAAQGEFIAFIDDDETAAPDWLEELMAALQRYDADGVRGPVVPVFPEGFPRRFRPLAERLHASIPEGAGFKENVATGNLLVRASVLARRDGPFDPYYGRTGGSDAELFTWLHGQGISIRGAARALVEELQPLKRASLTWHLRRAYRVGQTSSRIILAKHGLAGTWFEFVPWAMRLAIRTCIEMGTNMRAPLMCAVTPLIEVAKCLGRASVICGMSPVIEYKAEVKREDGETRSVVRSRAPLGACAVDKRRV